MKIRKAKIEDLNDLQELNEKIMVNNPKYDDDLVKGFMLTPAGRKYMKRAIENKKGIFLVAEDNGEMIGYVNGNEMNVEYRKSRYFEIENIGVIPENTRQGLGRLLLNKVTEWAKKQGLDRIYLICYAKNKDAHKFYKRNGFKEIDICFEKKIGD